jgi:hypothetical protein
MGATLSATAFPRSIPQLHADTPKNRQITAKTGGGGLARNQQKVELPWKKKVVGFAGFSAGPKRRNLP